MITAGQKGTGVPFSSMRTPDRSNRRVAEGLGVDDKTVGTVRRELEDGAEIPHQSERVGKARRKPVRTNSDKRKAVLTLLEDEEWGQWSNVEIARRCSVSDELVRKVRHETSLPTNGSEPSPPRTYTTKHGTQAA